MFWNPIGKNRVNPQSANKPKPFTPGETTHIDPLNPPENYKILMIITNTKTGSMDIQGCIGEEVFALGLLTRAMFVLEEFHTKARLMAKPR